METAAEGVTPSLASLCWKAVISFVRRSKEIVWAAEEEVAGTMTAASVDVAEKAVARVAMFLCYCCCCYTATEVFEE